MNIKLIVCDLDDTLLVNSLNPSKRIQEAIKSAKSKGVRVAIATGRMHISALPYAKILDVEDAVISCNGALIRNYKTDEILSETQVALDDAIDVLKFAKENDVYIQYYSGTDYYFYKDCEYSKYYHKMSGVKGIEVGRDLVDAIDFSPEKLLIHTTPEKASIVYKKAKELFDDKLNVTQSSPKYVEFNNPLASKGQACKKLASMYNISMEHVMTMGNGDNDYDMIKDAGFGVAVGNATDYLKSVADYIAPDHKKDGAAVAIEKYILNK